MVKRIAKICTILIGCLIIIAGCSSSKVAKKNRPYQYGWVPKTYQEVERDYHKHLWLTGCQQGETVASIGAGNGWVETEISCNVEGITWYLEEIDSSRLYQFEDVLEYHEKLKGSPVMAEFNLVLGTEASTRLPACAFDRILMINVFHEIQNKDAILKEIKNLLKEEGNLVIMERIAKKPNEIHGDCKYPKLFEPEFLEQMNTYGYRLVNKQFGERVSNLIYFTFQI